MVILAGLWFGYQAVRPSEPGSKEDLIERLAGFTPSSMHRTREFYQSGEECTVEWTCPSLTAYYAIDGAVGAARDAVLTRLQQEGIDVRPNEIEPNMLIANDEEHIYFFIFHEPPFDGPFDDQLPHSVEADVVISMKQPLRAEE